MRFHVDECLSPALAAWLRSLGHNAVSQHDVGKSELDPAVLARAVAEDRVLITRDNDFGELVYRDRMEHRGVLTLRFAEESPEALAEQLRGLMTSPNVDKLRNRITTMDESGLRPPLD